MKLARAVHLDTSDFQVFAAPAKTDEWCVAGGCVFADWRPADLTGKSQETLRSFLMFNPSWPLNRRAP